MRSKLLISFLITSVLALTLSHGATKSVYGSDVAASCDKGFLSLINKGGQYLKVVLIVEIDEEGSINVMSEVLPLPPKSEVEVPVKGDHISVVLDKGIIVRVSCTP